MLDDPTQLEAYLMAVGIGVVKGNRVEELELEALEKLAELLNAELKLRATRHTGVLH